MILTYKIQLSTWLDYLPYQDSSMGWMIPAIVALAIGFILGKVFKTKHGA